MRRLCERPGCGGVAAVSYGIDNEKLLVWIDSAPSLDPARAGSLCRRHADALSVPKGWSIDDRRQPVPMLFAQRDITPADGLASQSEKTSASSAKTTRKTQTKAHQSTEDISMFDADVVGDTTETESVAVASVEREIDKTEPQSNEPELEETRAIPWTPRLIASDGNDDTASIPKGRLLGRAFGERQPRRDAQ